MPLLREWWGKEEERGREGEQEEGGERERKGQEKGENEIPRYTSQQHEINLYCSVCSLWWVRYGFLCSSHSHYTPCTVTIRYQTMSHTAHTHTYAHVHTHNIDTTTWTQTRQLRPTVETKKTTNNNNNNDKDKQQPQQLLVLTDLMSSHSAWSTLIGSPLNSAPSNISNLLCVWWTCVCACACVRVGVSVCGSGGRVGGAWGMFVLGVHYHLQRNVSVWVRVIIRCVLACVVPV